MSTDREILEELCPEDPWTHSGEGLDDACLFCGGVETSRYESMKPTVHYHEVLCVWMKAMRHLGRDHPYHLASTQWRGVYHRADGMPHPHCLPEMGYRVEMIRGSLEHHIHMVGVTRHDGVGACVVDGSPAPAVPDKMPYLDGEERLYYRYLSAEPEVAAEQVAQD